MTPKDMEEAHRIGRDSALLAVGPEHRRKEISTHTAYIESRVADLLVEAYNNGVRDGRHTETVNIRKWLEEYKADSAIAKLLLQIMDREADIEAMS